MCASRARSERRKGRDYQIVSPGSPDFETASAIHALALALSAMRSARQGALCFSPPAATYRFAISLRSYSGDLRERVIKAVEMEGVSRHEAAERFDVNVSAVKWVQRWNASWSAAPKPRGGSVSSLEAHAGSLHTSLGALQRQAYAQIRHRLDPLILLGCRC